MLDELVIAFLGSLVSSCVVFFPLKLSGQWVYFWLTYYCTYCIGIGANTSLHIITLKHHCEQLINVHVGKAILTA